MFGETYKALDEWMRFLGESILSENETPVSKLPFVCDRSSANSRQGRCVKYGITQTRALENNGNLGVKLYKRDVKRCVPVDQRAGVSES